MFFQWFILCLFQIYFVMAPYNLIFLSKVTFLSFFHFSSQFYQLYVIFFCLNYNQILFQVVFHICKYLMKHISFLFKCCIIVSGCLLFGEENFPSIKYLDTPSSFINLLLLYCYQMPQYSLSRDWKSVFIATEDIVPLRCPKISFVDWIFHS